MTHSAAPPYRALRESVPNLSQRQVERDLGWNTGRLSVIERGLVPTPDEARQLREYYARKMMAGVTEAEEHDPGSPWNSGGDSR